MTSSIDPKSVAGKSLAVSERTQLLVVGAGPAGLAAAIDAAGRGISVMLVDENPVSATAMGEEVPLHFGQGFAATARNYNAMMEAFVASEPRIEEAFEAGVDVRLGTCVFGLYANGPSVGWLPGVVAGLADSERSWLVGCERVIVATGRRDMGLAFPGWELPRVMGVTAALRLATRFDALAPRRPVLLGTTAEALDAALVLQAAGITVAAVIEVAPAPVGPPDLVAAVKAAGIEILTGHVVREAQGRDGVEAVLVGAVDAAGVPTGGPERRIACDGVLLGVGTAPVVELMDALGCRIAFQAERGGYAPVLDQCQRTSLPFIYAVGDCAGVWPEKSRDRALAEAEARRAITDIATALGYPAEAAAAPQPGPATHDLAAHRLAWVRASVVEARGEPHVCQCEEVTAREILEVRPPRYLGWSGDRRDNQDLRSLLGEGPPNPDQVKRLTRAGMGPCQGRRCREQVAALLALGGGVPLAEVPLATHRAPVRPLSLNALADHAEDAAMAEHWDTWFGMAPQWRPFWDVPPLYTVATAERDGPVASE